MKFAYVFAWSIFLVFNVRRTDGTRTPASIYIRICIFFMLVREKNVEGSFRPQGQRQQHNRSAAALSHNLRINQAKTTWPAIVTEVTDIKQSLAALPLPSQWSISPHRSSCIYHLHCWFAMSDLHSDSPSPSSKGSEDETNDAVKAMATNPPAAFDWQKLLTEATSLSGRDDMVFGFTEHAFMEKPNGKPSCSGLRICWSWTMATPWLHEHWFDLCIFGYGDLALHGINRSNAPSCSIYGQRIVHRGNCIIVVSSIDSLWSWAYPDASQVVYSSSQWDMQISLWIILSPYHQ